MPTRTAGLPAETEQKTPEKSPSDTVQDRFKPFTTGPDLRDASPNNKVQTARAPAAAAQEAGNTVNKAKQALEQLPKGKIVLEAPQKMRVGEFRDVYANVGINVPIESLRKHTRSTDQSIEGTLSISSKMSAVLTGSGFKITRTTPEEQGVTEGFVTTWNWDIEAREEGEQELEAILYVTLPGISRQQIDSYRKKIGVSVKKGT